MANSQLLCNSFCNPEMLKGLARTRVMEIATDVLMLEGFSGKNFFFEPPTGNIFIFRDGDMVLMMDSGHHPYCRKAILDALQKMKREGGKDLILVMSHGHWDHGKNNDIIFEAGFERARFLLPEPERSVINIPAHMANSFNQALDYYDPYTIMPLGFRFLLEEWKKYPEYSNPKYLKVWKTIESLPDEYDREKTRAAYQLLMSEVLCPDLSSYIADRAELLSLASREKITYGKVEVMGWPVGRFFLIHDASQSPGHICVYDPEHKIMITGDATLEINPPFFDCNFNNCIDTCTRCRLMAEQGDILIATDCHRTSQFWSENFAAWGMEALSPIELIDVARGRDECIAFYRLFEEYFSALRNETLAAHARIGDATVYDIVTELGKSTNKYVIFKLGLRMPNIPSSPEMLVTRVLVESGAGRRVEDNRIIFTPAGK